MNRVKQTSRRCVGLVIAGFLFSSVASGAIVTLGEQDFNDGEIINLTDFNTASAGEAAPFDGFIGSDFSPDFDASWTFNYGAAPVLAAAVVFGIYDHDSQAPGDQVLSFTLDGFSLTTQLNAAFESHGGAQTEVNIYTLNIPVAALALLNDGMATFSLTLQGPGLPGTENNGAGLDFSVLRTSTANVVPEPSTFWLIGLGAAALGFRIRRSGQKNNK